MDDEKRIGLILTHYISKLGEIEQLRGMKKLLEDLGDETLKKILDDLEIEWEY